MNAAFNVHSLDSRVMGIVEMRHVIEGVRYEGLKWLGWTWIVSRWE